MIIDKFSDFVKKLDKGIFTFLLPLPQHLIRHCKIEYSYDFSNNFNAMTLIYSPALGGFTGELPIRKGQSISYRFSGTYKHGDSNFFINDKNDNFTIKIPETWKYETIEKNNFSDRLFEILDSGKTIFLGSDITDDLKRGNLLFNLLGSSPLEDCLLRSNENAKLHELEILLPQNKTETFFNKLPSGSNNYSPTKFYNERIDDKTLNKVKNFRISPVSSGTLLDAVFESFEKKYYFPLLGKLTLNHPHGKLPKNNISIISHFFSTYIDHLCIDNILISQK